MNLKKPRKSNRLDDVQAIKTFGIHKESAKKCDQPPNFVKANRVGAKWWKSAIGEGQRMRAGLDLSMIYMEIGKRFQEDKSNLKN